jgi:hypothetical protein
MDSRSAWLPLPALVVLGLLWFAPGCLAAGPIKGGRYAGPSIAFNVGDNGRAFVSNPHRCPRRRRSRTSRPEVPTCCGGAGVCPSRPDDRSRGSQTNAAR